MELPHLGKNCALKQCNQLDFLPVKCDACDQVFCLRHYKYDTHGCEKAKNKDVQVPVCPLCSQPVVSKRNELPDIAVSQHIDQYCKQNDQVKHQNNKPKTNLQACNFKSCKQKDLIYLECKDCRSKFCIKHRHPSDHLCSGPPFGSNLSDNWHSFKGSCSSSASSGIERIKNKAQQISKQGQAALNRLANSTASGGPSSSRAPAANRGQPAVRSLQGNISEQEALAIALNESRLNRQATGAFQQEDEDQALARALHESQLEASRNHTAQTAGKDSCVLS